MHVADLTEEQLLALIVPELPLGSSTLLGPGDDAAIVAAPDGRFVVTTDVLVEDRHFRRAWSSGEDVGRRAAVQNLADVAAMGAVPTSLVVTLAVPGELDVAWVVGLARGLAAVCGPLGVGVVGGDLSGSPLVVVSVAAHGDLQGRPPVLRSGARVGDVVAHAGVLGRSAAGLALVDRAAAGGPPGRATTTRPTTVSSRPTCGRRHRCLPARTRLARARPRCSTSPTGCCGTPGGWRARAVCGSTCTRTRSRRT